MVSEVGKVLNLKDLNFCIQNTCSKMFSDFDEFVGFLCHHEITAEQFTLCYALHHDKTREERWNFDRQAYEESGDKKANVYRYAQDVQGWSYEDIDTLVERGFLIDNNQRSPKRESYPSKFQVTSSFANAVSAFDSLTSIKGKDTTQKIFRKQYYNFKKKRVHLGTYHPYWGGRNQRFDDFSVRILDVKEARGDFLDYFCPKLEEMLNPQCEFALVVFPSHDPANTNSGIRQIAQRLARKNNWVDATHCLKRHTKVPKQATNGSRKVSTHLRSIKIVDLPLIQKQPVLLLDDVTTTGTSLNAASRILERAGVEYFQFMALAQTASYS